MLKPPNAFDHLVQLSHLDHLSAFYKHTNRSISTFVKRRDCSAVVLLVINNWTHSFLSHPLASLITVLNAQIARHKMTYFLHCMMEFDEAQISCERATMCFISWVGQLQVDFAFHSCDWIEGRQHCQLLFQCL